MSPNSLAAFPTQAGFAHAASRVTRAFVAAALWVNPPCLILLARQARGLAIRYRRGQGHDVPPIDAWLAAHP